MAPVSLAFASGLMSIFIIWMPPIFYENTIGEENLMFGDFILNIFIIFCVSSFVFGCWLHKKLFPDRGGCEYVVGRRVTRKAVISIALMLASSLLVLYALANYFSGVGLSVLAGSGAEALRSDNIADGSAVGFSPLSLLPIVSVTAFYTLASYNQCERIPENFITSLWRGMMYICIPMFIVSFMLLLQRSLLIPLFVGLVIVMSATKWHVEGVKTSSLVQWGVLISSVVIAFFLITGYLRSGDDGGYDWYYFLVGYVPASYNRLAATLDGLLVPPSPGVGFYSLRFFWHPPLMSQVFTVAAGKASTCTTSQRSQLAS